MNLLAMSFWEYLQSNLLLTIILGALLALIVIVSIALAVTVKKSKKRKAQEAEAEARADETR